MATTVSRKKQRAADQDGGHRRFQRMEVVGTGSFGVVHRARDRRTGEIVAMKCLRANAGYSSAAFVNEVKALEACTGQPHIVQPRTHFFPPGSGEAFVVMEFVGPTLSHVMKKVRFGRRHSETEVRRMMTQLLTGVNSMHRLGLMHRDLKPDNVLVGGKGSLKICDLGLSCSTADGPPYSSRVGTLRYRSPELLLGSTDYDGRVDSWALGVIMAELLAGKKPFHGRSETEQLAEIFDLLGTKDMEEWSGYAGKQHLLPGGCSPESFLRCEFPQKKSTPICFGRSPPELSEAGFEVLSGLLRCNPEKRLTPAAALQHRWFKGVNLPSPNPPSIRHQLSSLRIAWKTMTWRRYKKIGASSEASSMDSCSWHTPPSSPPTPPDRPTTTSLPSPLRAYLQVSLAFGFS